MAASRDALKGRWPQNQDRGGRGGIAVSKAAAQPQVRGHSCPDGIPVG
jgi:hypothetical protein